MRKACTWKGCAEEACRRQIGKDGREWADLCAPHDVELKAAQGSSDVKVILKSWILAQGGAEKAAERMKPDVKTAQRLGAALASLIEKGRK